MAVQSLSRRSPLLDEAPRGVIYATFWTAIVVQYFYVFTFNFFPDLRLPLSSALTGIHVVLAAIALLLRPAIWSALLALAVAIFLALLIPPHMFGWGEVASFDMVEAIRVIVPALVLIWMLTFPLAVPVHLLAWCAVLGTLIGAAIAYGGEPLHYNINDPEPRLASITGGAELVHPSARFMAIQIITLDLLRRGGFMSPRLTWPLIGLCAAVMLGHGARSQMAFVLAYFGSHLYFQYRHIVVVRFGPALIGVLTVTGIALALMVGEDTERWGSGRVGTWGYRLGLIAERDLATLLFGGGLGADNIWTPVWGWADDEFISHNDFLYFLTDHGIVGLLFPVLFLVAAWLRLQDLGRAIIVGVIVMSWLDNGFFRSPLTATSLTLVLVLSLVVSMSTTATAGRDGGRPEAQG